MSGDEEDDSLEDIEDEAIPTQKPANKKKVRGILSLFMWNQVLVIASLFLAMMGVQTITAEDTSFSGMAVSAFLLILAIGLLITSADFFVEGAKGIARRAGIAEVIIGLTIVSLGTSLPEILISSQAAWEAYLNPCQVGATDCATDFALGNIYGSILVQITLILGIVVIIRPMKVKPAWIQRDGAMMFLAVLLLSMLILVDGDLNRLEGGLLCLIYEDQRNLIWVISLYQSTDQKCLVQQHKHFFLDDLFSTYYSQFLSITLFC